MGSWGSGAEDNSIGPIVWVRRRNGSWWPGKIMEPHELQECNLTSPRTGTPVKLLGREDASVDWYNLEKSKRVKSFRCGEFDDCIERAESAQGMPIKKREKYARREDAILHALELEKQLGLSRSKSSDCLRSKSYGSTKKEIGAFSDSSGHNDGKLGDAQSNKLVGEVDIDSKDEHPGNLNTIDGNQPIWEDDHSEVTLRMRGLQDFGLRTTPLKRKLSSSVNLDGSGRPMSDDHSQDLPNGASRMQGTAHLSGVAQSASIYGAKRSMHGYLSTESSDSMDDDEELPASKLRTTPSQFGDNDFHLQSLTLNDENSSLEFVDDDSSVSNSSESQTDSSETEADIDKERTVYSDAAVHTDAEQAMPGLGRHEAPGEHGNASTEESDGSAFSGDMSLLYPGSPYLANEAVSRWQLKRKRNIRHLAKKYADGDHGRSSNGLHHRFKGSSLDQRAYGVNFDKKYYGKKLVGLDHGSYPCISRFSSKRWNSFGRDMIDWEDMAWEDQPVYGRHWENRRGHFNPIFVGRHNFGGRMESMLIDVDLKVQASYKKKRVPIVSLMSKVNGMAIIGHPIQIEALEDGLTEPLIPTSDYYGSEVADNDGNAALPPAWRTAKRTNFRVPRPALSSMLAGGDAVEDIAFMEKERRLPFKEPSSVNFGQRPSLVRKSPSHIPLPRMDRKFSRKLPKKVSTPNQKTRTLSSITRPVHDASGQMDRLLKPESSGLTTVACIPVKLVFSRLLEKINRPPSKATIDVVVPNRDGD